ncbi:MAG: hypothetical protein JXA07_04115 [Spirochaetes bacterium]|nr:hypothetical protein [Spirochaetota bacterium]
MAKEIDMELRESAEEMYIIDGLTFEQVSERTDVHVNTLKKWAKSEGWKERRAEYRQTVRDIKQKKLELMRHLLNKALTSEGTSEAYAYARLEEVSTKTQKELGPPQTAGAAPLQPRNIDTPEEAVAALRESIQIRVNAMLSGNFTSKEITDIEKTMKLVEKLEAKYIKDKPESKRKRTLDENTKKEIREIYGLS